MASGPDHLAPLLAALRAFGDWLTAIQSPGMVIGGVAVTILGRPRMTRDVDGLVLVEESRWPEVLQVGKAVDLTPRIGDAVEFARQSRMLLLRHEPSQIDVDVAIGALPFEIEAVANRRFHEIAATQIPLPAVEDLIVMKALAHRDRDLADIAGLLAVTATVDEARIRRWVAAFAELAVSPEILDSVERLLSARNKPQRKPI